MVGHPNCRRASRCLCNFICVLLEHLRIALLEELSHAIIRIVTVVSAGGCADSAIR
jgi:hypothetical protein